jgi:type I restriction enzyme M protein
VFAPYTTIATNVLFLTKGQPTQHVWYYEHPLPHGYKAYNKSKPMRIAEFDIEKSWWEERKETEQAWKVSISEIVDSNYNLDIKNPNSAVDIAEDPQELLKNLAAIDSHLRELRLRISAFLQDPTNV